LKAKVDNNSLNYYGVSESVSESDKWTIFQVWKQTERGSGLPNGSVLGHPKKAEIVEKKAETCEIESCEKGIIWDRQKVETEVIIEFC